MLAQFAVRRVTGLAPDSSIAMALAARSSDHSLVMAEPYVGIERLDPIERQKQHALADALWQLLNEKGVRRGSIGQIDVFLYGEEKAAASLAGMIRRGGWSAATTQDGEPGRVRVQVTTDDVVFSRDAFIDLTDIMMVAAADHGCVYDGVEVAVHAVKKRPWWQFW